MKLWRTSSLMNRHCLTPKDFVELDIFSLTSPNSMKSNYKILLNKKDPFDRETLKPLRLAKERKLKVGIAELGKFIK